MSVRYAVRPIATIDVGNDLGTYFHVTEKRSDRNPKAGHVAFTLPEAIEVVARMETHRLSGLMWRGRKVDGRVELHRLRFGLEVHGRKPMVFHTWEEAALFLVVWRVSDRRRDVLAQHERVA